MVMEQTLLTWVHLLAASIWVGGSIFLGVVLSPALRVAVPDVAERLRLIILIGRRFNKIAVPSLIVLMATGLYNSHTLLASPHLLGTTGYGANLAIKMGLVLLLVVVYVAHVMTVRGNIEERIVAGKMSPEELQNLRRRVIILGEATVIISVAILFFAAVLDSGGY